MWWWAFFGAAIVVPQALAWVLRRRDSHLAGPVSLITSVVLRAIAGMILVWLALRLATGYAFWVVVPAALLGGLGVWSLAFTVLLVTATLHAAFDKSSAEGQATLPGWLRHFPSGRLVLFIPFFAGAAMALVAAVASHYG